MAILSTLKTKDADVATKYLHVIEAGTSGEPHEAVVPDYRIPYAMGIIKSNYSHTVSVREKSKSLIKFGKNNAITSGTPETVWKTGGDETYKTANDIDIVVSTNAGDTQDIVIEGHTLTGSDFTFVTQTAILNGTTNVTLTTPLARVGRLYNNDNTDFAGTITVEDNLTSVHLTVDEGNESEKCATTISSTDYWIITHLAASVGRTTTSSAVDFNLQVRESGKVFRTIYEFTVTNTGGFSEIEFAQPIIVPPNSDVRMRAAVTGTGMVVSCAIHGYLAIIT